MRALLAAAAALIASALPASAQQRILIASDSTAANYGTDRYPQTGWGMMLKCGLQPDVEVINRAVGGRSTRTFLSEGKWDALLAEAKPGDVVLIQFGHNDASASRPERYAPAATLYRDNLLRMIWESRGRGLIPVLVTPPARRSFEGGRAKADFTEWSKVERELVASTNTPLIDLEARSLDFVSRAGEAGSKKYYLHYAPDDGVAAFPNGIADDTHFSELGARAMANLVAQELKGLKLPVAEKVLNDRPDLTRTTPLGSVACH
ncbi:rhamnogalacturonan acetylesterase [Sphingomonas psychrotolerans]|uniref:Rhamnogalacturonan acetylesterase n=1 Tax=Sphingomonas psychrotolerans TaxID=1327635 RepID=A0ABU3NC43_9SPHN|nr:rhamnogalacturonan acetylesterase [Sphingomonas psychrotolerans]MDT8761071.1 rhamnogalacturonan acetylesterase [Sphingomonas psychrotolerans]